MQNYYFTFGQSHWHRDGIPMKNYWVRVKAEGYYEARELFVSEFSSIYMQAPDKWAFQYESHKFRKEFFPGGEFILIEQKKETV
jgi:hypothetical protein